MFRFYIHGNNYVGLAMLCQYPLVPVFFLLVNIRVFSCLCEHKCEGACVARVPIRCDREVSSAGVGAAAQGTVLSHSSRH